MNPLSAIGLTAGTVDVLRLLSMAATGDIERFWFQVVWLVVFGGAGFVGVVKPPAAIAGGGGTAAYLLWSIFDPGEQCTFGVCI